MNLQQLSLYDDYVIGQDSDMTLPPGSRHYQLLSYLSHLTDGQHIVDISDTNGCNSYALAYNSKNCVFTFDASSKSQNNLVILNQFDFEHYNDTLVSSNLVCVDLPNRSGAMEYQIYQHLLKLNYRGIMVCNGIWSSKQMRDTFWSLIPQSLKSDVTLIGHEHGTGIIHFGHQIADLNLQPIDNSDWTLVTAYFDLSHTPDVCDAMRSKEYYMNHAQGVMMSPYNLVVYCDQSSLVDIQQMRPLHLKEKTKYIVLDFDSLRTDQDPRCFAELRNCIIANRCSHPYAQDPRNNASYYLFCLSRYSLVKRTIRENPFGSTHFAWINICIERMGYGNLSHLDSVLALHRDKFSTCYIDYIPQELVNNTVEYFKFGRCSMCSGFFTGNTKYMYDVCDLIEKEFFIQLEKGYGHADEQLYSPVYFKHPELFEHYYGDYTEMIINYVHVYEHAHKIIEIFIKHSYEHHNYLKCLECCEYVWKSYCLKTCVLTQQQLQELSYYRVMCHFHLKSNDSRKQNERSQCSVITSLYNVGNPERCMGIISNVKDWLKCSLPMIIWTDDTYYEQLCQIFESRDNVTIINRPLISFPPFTDLEMITKLYHLYKVHNRHPVKDSIMYHMLMFSRPYMWQESMSINPYNSDGFICTDIGISRFTGDLSVIDNWNVNTNHTVKMLLINPYVSGEPSPKDYFRLTRHNIAGGMVTGTSTAINRLICYFDQELKQMIADQWLQLDEVIWTLVARKHPDVFDFYYGDYCGIISNYNSLRDYTNICNIIQKYLDNRLYPEAQRVINRIDVHYSDQLLYIYVKYSILTNYFVYNKKLHTNVKHLIESQQYRGILGSLLECNKSNLAYYTNVNFS